jgi:hypothetical protein
MFKRAPPLTSPGSIKKCPPWKIIPQFQSAEPDSAGPLKSDTCVAVIVGVGKW